MPRWERFDENFDAENGGCLYLANINNGNLDYNAAGIQWLDGGSAGLHYFAFVTGYIAGETTYDGIEVTDLYSCADAFNDATDSDIVQEIGWFATMDEAVAAVEDAVSGYLA